MANYYDFGIDLGTTNSCIAKQEGDGVKVFQNLDNMNVTPSAVYIAKNGRMLVGRRAYDKIISEPQNTAVEFKRLMGVDTKKHFASASRDLSPVELSAEILKALREDVQRQTGASISNSIITVPAAFGTVQCEDTQKAASLAGFDNVMLLQEPIAAGIAYGSKEENHDQYWMVFDFGGGTLDIAIISTFDGRLTIVNHEGDNYLGGKNIDEAIYAQVILPVLQKDFRLPRNPEKMEFIHRKLLTIAEDAKKTLSTAPQAILDVFDIGDDEGGEPIEARITLDKARFEELIAPIVQKSISLCEKTILEARLSAEKLSKIILVGGTTLIPSIREGLTNSLPIPIDTSIDPMTAVAVGAALYGATCKLPETAVVKDELVHKVAVSAEYEAITSEDSANIVGKFTLGEGVTAVSQVKIDAVGGFWSSGWVDVWDTESGLFDIDVMLQKDSVNDFTVSARGAAGELLEVANPELRIKHQASALIASAPPIPHSISVEVNGEEGARLEPILKKGTTLPARASRTFKADVTIAPKGSESLAVKVWEGESLGNPADNQWVGNIYVRPESIDRSIPEGCDVDVEISIDVSRTISVTVYVPHLDYEISGDLVYTVEGFDVRGPMEEMSANIAELRTRLCGIRGQSCTDNIRMRCNDIEDELDEVEAEYYQCKELVGLDDDRIMLLLRRYNSLVTQIAKIESCQRNANKHGEDVQEIELTKSLVHDLGDSNDQSKLRELEQGFRSASDAGDDKGAAYYRERLDQLRVQILVNNIDFLKLTLARMCDPSMTFSDEAAAMEWKMRGIAAANSNDIVALREAVGHLFELSRMDITQVLSERELRSGLR